MNDLRYAFSFIKKYKLKFIAGIVFIVFSNLLAVYIPLLVKEAIDAIQKIKNIYDILPYLLKLFFISLLAGIFRYYIRQTIIAASREIENDMRNEFWLKTLSLSPKNFEEKSIGSIMALATNDIAAIRMFVGPAFMYLTDTLFRAIFILHNMISLNLGLTLYSLLPFPFLAFLTYIVSAKTYEIFSKIQDQFGVLTEQARETLSGIRIIKAFKAENAFRNLFEYESEEYLKKNIKLAKLQSLFQPGLFFFAGSSMAIILYIGGVKIINNEISVGDLTAFLIYSFMLIWPMIAFGWVANISQQARASSRRLNEWIESIPAIKDSKDAVEKNNLKGDIEFKGVYFKYFKGQRWVLKNVSLNIKRNSITAIVGRTGSGKTTIANLICRLYDPDQGEIKIDGFDIKRISLASLRNNIAYVLQEPFIFSDSLRSNLTYASKNNVSESFINYSKLAEFDKDVQSFPQQYDTLLGEKGINLSGGQKQRAAITQALASERNILIFDDSFSALDSNTENSIFENLKKLSENKTIIIITHKISIASKADSIIVIDDGTIAEAGNHQELLEKKGVYWEIFELEILKKELEEYN